MLTFLTPSGLPAPPVPVCPLTMTDEVVYHPGVPSDLCLLSADGVRLRVHKQVLACACGTFAHALDAVPGTDELPVEETAQELQASGGGDGAGGGGGRGVWAGTRGAAAPRAGLAHSAQATFPPAIHGTFPHLQEGLLDHLYFSTVPERSSQRHLEGEDGPRLSLELGRKYDCPALMQKCEDFLCCPAFQLSALPR